MRVLARVVQLFRSRDPVRGLLPPPPHAVAWRGMCAANNIRDAGALTLAAVLLINTSLRHVNATGTHCTMPCPHSDA